MTAKVDAARRKVLAIAKDVEFDYTERAMVEAVDEFEAEIRKSIAYFPGSERCSFFLGLTEGQRSALAIAAREGLRELQHGPRDAVEEILGALEGGVCADTR